MGMFDDIFVTKKLKLPGYPEDADRWFQTKCLENLMTKFKLVKLDGTMEKRFVEYESAKLIPENTSLLEKLQTGFKIKSSRWLDYPYHGDIEIHTFIDSTCTFYSYTLRFTEGKFVKIVAHKIEPPSEGDEVYGSI